MKLADLMVKRRNPFLATARLSGILCRRRSYFKAAAMIAAKPLTHDLRVLRDRRDQPGPPALFQTNTVELPDKSISRADYPPR